MKNEQKISNLLLGVFLAVAILFTGCSPDDTEDTNVEEEDESTSFFFISATYDDAEYILTTDSLNEDLSIVGEGTELEQSGYNWIFSDDHTSTVGLIYQQGDPGIGLGYTVDTTGLVSLGQFQITSRFTSYGFFGDYALTSVGGQTLTDDDGNALTYDDGTERTDGATFNFIDTDGSLSLETKSILTKDLVSPGQQVTFSGIVDNGDGTFMTGAVVSQAQDESASGGASTGTVLYPDSCWVVSFDEDLTVQNIYRSNKISYASGRYRSQYYSQIDKDADNNTYVFSGSHDESSTLSPGALRINDGASDFDDSYYFNIGELTDGYHFRKVWHITDDYFLLEFYNLTADDSDFNANSTPAHQYGIVKMEDQTFNWVGGDLPESSEISDMGQPMAYDGDMYLPITTDSDYPAIYIIDPETATATKGITVTSGNIEAIGLLTAEE